MSRPPKRREDRRVVAPATGICSRCGRSAPALLAAARGGQWQAQCVNAKRCDAQPRAGAA